MEYIINTIWDNDAKVWIATSDDLPGLVLESGSLDALMERVRIAAPEILALNGTIEGTVPLFFKSERHDQVYV